MTLTQEFVTAPTALAWDTLVEVDLDFERVSLATGKWEPFGVTVFSFGEMAEELHDLTVRNNWTLTNVTVWE